MKPNDTITLYVNQGRREAVVLAIIGQKALIEYEMPKGSTALRFVNVAGTGNQQGVSYFDLPTKWLEAIVANGLEWIGRPQKRRSGILSALSMLSRRREQRGL